MIRKKLKKAIDIEYEFLLDNIQDIFDKTDRKVFEARNTIKLIDFNNKTLAIKSYKVPHFINQIIYRYFRSSKAKKSYYNALRLKELAINTSNPIGYINFGRFLLKKSFFISENVIFDYHIKDVLIDNEFLNRQKILKEFAIFSKELHDKGVFHLDFSGGNILIKNFDINYKFFIVDINRIKFKALTLEERMKNFAKLWISDDDLEIIIKEYSFLLKKDFNKCFSMAKKFSKEHKNKINMKKRIRGQEVVD